MECKTVGQGDRAVVDMATRQQLGREAAVRGSTPIAYRYPQAHSHNMPYQLACPDEPVCDTDSTVQVCMGRMHTHTLERMHTNTLTRVHTLARIWAG
jgi:hypothetical protein